MQIRIKENTPSGSASARCPFCLDDLDQGVACTACRALYHADCAQVFGSCAALGCPGTLTDRIGLAALPRLVALARRLASWQPSSLAKVRPETSLVVLWPSAKARSSKEAARVVAEILGPEHSLYDGRLRLQVPYPEPLARADSLDIGLEAVARLEGAGVRASLLPMLEVLAIQAPFQVRALSGPPWEARNPAGEARLLDPEAPHLFLTTRFCEEKSKVTTKLQRKTNARGRSTYRQTTSVFPKRTARPEAAAILVTPDQPPWLLRATQSTREGTIRAWPEVVRALSQGAEVREIKGMTLGTLLTLVRAGGGRGATTIRDNTATLMFQARLHQLDWERASQR
tara:strand:+ start:263 stop:1288 length:1026 start_codon:yes stop_codon:yes gene_type:complete